MWAFDLYAEVGNREPNIERIWTMKTETHKHIYAVTAG